MRLGDSYFATSNYNSAIAAYEKATRGNTDRRDYAAFQIALSQGFLGEGTAKVRSLEEFSGRFPKSAFRDDALFELANTYSRENQEAKALATYDRLIRDFPNSKFVSQSLLRQGLVNYNQARNEEALALFRQVVKEYGNSQEAVQAVATAKLIYVELGRVDEYADWVRQLDFVEVTDAELDQASFEAADRKYAAGDVPGAIRGYEKYLRQFPSGLYALRANFLLAQLQFAEGQNAEALPYFLKVAESGSGEYWEQATTRVCEIYVAGDDYDKAMPYLLQLEERAEIPQNRVFARSNLMKTYFDRQDYDRTLQYAEQVLAADGVDQRILDDARVMIAKAAMATGNETRAREAYAQVLETATGPRAAEALYYQAFFAHQDKEFEASNQAVQRLAKDYASQREWGAKGLLLMAENFYELGDVFQATYILENIEANFTDYPELVEEAKTTLNNIKLKEANRNSSIDPEGN